MPCTNRISIMITCLFLPAMLWAADVSSVVSAKPTVASSSTTQTTTATSSAVDTKGTSSSSGDASDSSGLSPVGEGVAIGLPSAAVVGIAAGVVVNRVQAAKKAANMASQAEAYDKEIGNPASNANLETLEANLSQAESELRDAFKAMSTAALKGTASKEAVAAREIYGQKLRAKNIAQQDYDDALNKQNSDGSEEIGTNGSDTQVMDAPIASTNNLSNLKSGVIQAEKDVDSTRSAYAKAVKAGADDDSVSDLRTAYSQKLSDLQDKLSEFQSELEKQGLTEDEVPLPEGTATTEAELKALNAAGQGAEGSGVTASEAAVDALE